MPVREPQLEMFRPQADDPNVLWFADLLFINGQWMTAAKVIEMVPLEFRERSERAIDDRQVRAWAEAAAPKVISGQRGYKHTDHATAEEIKAFIATMESQGSKMLARAHKVRTYAHAKIG
jgi:hypothetical protein